MQLPFSGLSPQLDSSWMRAHWEGTRGATCGTLQGFKQQLKPKRLLSSSGVYGPALWSSTPFPCFAACVKNAQSGPTYTVSTFLCVLGYRATYTQEYHFPSCRVKPFLKWKIRISPIYCCCCRQHQLKQPLGIPMFITQKSTLTTSFLRLLKESACTSFFPPLSKSLTGVTGISTVSSIWCSYHAKMKIRCGFFSISSECA